VTRRRFGEQRSDFNLRFRAQHTPSPAISNEGIAPLN
jgi:hypothetical protein